ncbi:MAG: TPM domain-containing protein [Flavobacteriales bacterium]|nr:TPM domain-containing protein [Flavobacteriales bacterium]
MRNLLFIFLLAIPFSVFSQNFPARSNRLVNDFTGTLSGAEISQLEQKLVAYDRESSVQIAIVIIKSLDGYEISDYAFELGEKWGVGRSGKDNGALILVSMADHKMWIATGYGLEATLTDAMCKRIIENEMKPRFRQDDYAGGLASAADAMILATRGEYKGEGGSGDGAAAPIGSILFIVLVFGIVWLIKAKQVRDYSRVNNMGFWAAWMLLNAASRNHPGSYGSFRGGSGGFSGGGGGGFGGFGGGSFGGGGAGGSW